MTGSISSDLVFSLGLTVSVALHFLADLRELLSGSVGQQCPVLVTPPSLR